MNPLISPRPSATADRLASRVPFSLSPMRAAPNATLIRLPRDRIVRKGVEQVGWDVERQKIENRSLFDQAGAEKGRSLPVRKSKGMRGPS